MTEAVSHLQKGLEVLRGLPVGTRRNQQELDLLIALGPPRIAAGGFSAPDLAETYARAHHLAEQLNRSEFAISLLYGQWAFHVVRSEYNVALSLAQRLEQIGEMRNDEVALLLGHFEHGATCLWLGELVTARDLFEQCHRMNYPAHRSFYVAITGTDQYLTTLSELSLTLTVLGYLEQGRACVRQALSGARQLGHPHSLAFVLHFAAWVEATAGRLEDAKRHAEELFSLSNEHGFALWMASAEQDCGIALIGLGQPQQGIVRLSEALPKFRAAGPNRAIPSALMHLAAGYGKVGQLEKGLECLDEVVAITELSAERWMEADLHRLRGDLLNATGDRLAAEQSYCTSLAVARRQSAKALELRTATSLARLWRDQGKRIEARDLLAPVYGWFTEGFDTPALKETKALLDSLG
jgi:tetratricopeptide (TPR) repeat protein